MIVRQRVKRAVVAGALGLAVASGGIATASTAQAADTGTDKISCKAVKVHKSYSTGSTTVGIAYKGDKITYSQWVYQKAKEDLVGARHGDPQVGPQEDPRLRRLPVRQPVQHLARAHPADPEVAERPEWLPKGRAAAPGAAGCAHPRSQPHRCSRPADQHPKSALQAVGAGRPAPAPAAPECAASVLPGHFRATFFERAL